MVTPVNHASRLYFAINVEKKYTYFCRYEVSLHLFSMQNVYFRYTGIIMQKYGSQNKEFSNKAFREKTRKCYI